MWIGMLKVRLVVYINVDRGLRVNVDRGLRVRVFVFQHKTPYTLTPIYINLYNKSNL
jgi:hypothetical protein